MGGCLSGNKNKAIKGFETESEPVTENIIKFKVVVLGDVAVGKTSILNFLKGIPQIIKRDGNK